MPKSDGWKFVLSRLLPLRSARVYAEPEELTSQIAIDVLPDPICIVSGLGRIFQTNAAFDSLLHAHPMDYIRSHLTEDSKGLLEEAFYALQKDGTLYQKVDLAFITSSIRSGARNEKSNMIMLLGR